MKRKPVRETEEQLREGWGQDIPVSNELDPKYIPVSDDWLPIPMIIEEKTYKKNLKRMELGLTTPAGVRSVKVKVTSHKKPTKTVLKPRRKKVVQY